MKYQCQDFLGYHIYSLKTDRFKNCYIEFLFRSDLRQINSAAFSFLAMYLWYVSEKYPTRQEMRIALEELYDATFRVNSSRVGYQLFTSFSLDFIHPRFVKEKDYLDQILSFLVDVLQHPLREKGVFSTKIVNELKEQFHHDLDAYQEYPASVAMLDAKQKLFPDSISGKRVMGSHEEIDAITPQNLAQEFLNFYRDSYCDILVGGDLDMKAVSSFFQKHFQKSSIVTKPIPFTVYNHFPKFSTCLVDSSYEQTQLILFYRIDALSDFERYYCLPLFTKIFASAGMNDKLTRYLRVEESLCYSNFFTFQADDRVAYIRVGLSYENIPNALKMIRKAKREMNGHGIDPTFLETQKRAFLSDIKIRKDSLYALLDQFYFTQIKNSPSFEDYEKIIPTITVQDIHRFSQKLHEVFLYVLKERENGKN